MTTHTVTIVGAKYRRPALALLEALPHRASLILRREPENVYDANAIQVLVKTSVLSEIPLDHLEICLASSGFEVAELYEQDIWHLGYVPRDYAAKLAPYMSLDDLAAELTFSPSGAPCATFEGTD